MSNLRTSDGETGDAHFEFGHLIEPVLLRIAARAKPDCSSFIKKLPALLGVNVNAATRMQAFALTAVGASQVIVRMAMEPSLQAGHLSFHAVRKRLAQINIACRFCMPHCVRRNQGCNSSDREAMYAQSHSDRAHGCSVEISQRGIL
jgi:hypothetical protein